jgi:DNA-binding IscR family transcriptional regulator
MLPINAALTTKEIAMVNLLKDYLAQWGSHPVTEDLSGHSSEIYSKRTAASVLRSLEKKGIVQSKSGKGFGEKWTVWIINAK